MGAAGTNTSTTTAQHVAEERHLTAVSEARVCSTAQCIVHGGGADIGPDSDPDLKDWSTSTLTASMYKPQEIYSSFS